MQIAIECRGWACRALILVLVSVPATGRTQAFHDFARVVQVTPLEETRRVPVRREICESTPAGGSVDEKLDALIGDVRARQPGVSLANALLDDRMLQDAVRAMRPQCRLAHTYDERTRILGYEVRYRYSGEEFVRRMSHDPGEWVRVRIKVHASP